MKLKVWSPRDGELANFQSKLVRIYFGENREDYAERRWIDRRPDGYYESHRSCKGEAIGEFRFQIDRLPEVLKNLSITAAAATGLAGDEMIFEGLWMLADDPATPILFGNAAARKAKAKAIKAEFKKFIAPLRSQLEVI